MKEHRWSGNTQEAWALLIGPWQSPIRVISCSLLLLSVLCGVGCDSSGKETAAKPAPETTTKSTAAKSPPSDGETDDGAIPFRAVDSKGLEAVIALSQGKVVLVDFWATWCVPCIQGLPKNAELVQKHSGKGFVVVTMAMDEQTEEESEAEFWKRLSSPLGPHAASFTNLIGKEGGSEEAMSAYGIEGGALPHYRLYGRDGKLLKTFVSGDPDQVWEHADVQKAVLQALGN